MKTEILLKQVLVILYLFWIQLKRININLPNKANDRSDGNFTKLMKMKEKQIIKFGIHLPGNGQTR